MQIAKLCRGNCAHKLTCFYSCVCSRNRYSLQLSCSKNLSKFEDATSGAFSKSYKLELHMLAAKVGPNFILAGMHSPSCTSFLAESMKLHKLRALIFNPRCGPQQVVQVRFHKNGSRCLKSWQTAMADALKTQGWLVMNFGSMNSLVQIFLCSMLSRA